MKNMKDKLLFIPVRDKETEVKILKPYTNQ